MGTRVARRRGSVCGTQVAQRTEREVLAEGGHSLGRFSPGERQGGTRRSERPAQAGLSCTAETPPRFSPPLLLPQVSP